MLSQFIIKVFAKLNLWVGMVFRKARPPYAFSEIKSILVKRTDRIGDAVFTLPLILELGKHYKVTVLTSRYNDVFLKEFVETKIFADMPLDFINCIKMIAWGTPLGRSAKGAAIPQYDLCLDLNGLRELDVFLKIRENNLCRYYAGFNMGIWNASLDYSSCAYPALFTKTHLLESCIRFVREALGIQVDICDYIDFSEKMVRPRDFDYSGSYILVNIGGIEKYRGPSPRHYAELLNALEYEGGIIVMDDLDRPHTDEFKKYIQKKNVRYLQKYLPIWELLYIAYHSQLYIGTDSGISNLLQVPTHAVLFFATGAPLVWRPYSKNPYWKKRLKGLIIEETLTSKKLCKKIVYAPVWCRPCFDIGCKKSRCISSFGKNLPAIANLVQQSLCLPLPGH